MIAKSLCRYTESIQSVLYLKPDQFSGCSASSLLNFVQSFHISCFIMKADRKQMEMQIQHKPWKTAPVSTSRSSSRLDYPERWWLKGSHMLHGYGGNESPSFPPRSSNFQVHMPIDSRWRWRCFAEPVRTVCSVIIPFVNVVFLEELLNALMEDSAHGQLKEYTSHIAHL